jgi:hypothetical protein
MANVFRYILKFHIIFNPFISIQEGVPNQYQILLSKKDNFEKQKYSNQLINLPKEVGLLIEILLIMLYK